MGENFFPALGFVNRTGIRLYDGTVGRRTRYRARDDFLRTFDISTRHQFFTDLHDRIESRDSRFSAEVLTASDHSFGIEAVNLFEHLSAPFVVPTNIIVPRGDYEWTNAALHMQTSNGLPLFFTADVTCCNYYNGRAVQGHFVLNYRPSQFYELQATYDPSFIDLPGGDVDIHVMALNGIINFTPDMQFAMQAQYDNISRNFAFLGRYRWEFRPGSEIFVALGQGATITEGQFLAQVTQFSFRLGHTLRF